jgi:glycosidase
MTLPVWINDAVFYQIFPDRFANGDPSNDPVNVKPWGSKPTHQGFQGGDLKGIRDHFDYLLDLGINAIYLNPIFQSPSTHRYDTVDYYRIDPRVGDEQEFLDLLEFAHKKKVRIILDGVFNHSSRGFFAFSDILENGDQSPYKDWYHIKKYPINAYGHGDAADYLGWWNNKSLPKFNTFNPDTRSYIMRVVRYWTERGIDGWRLDVPCEIDDDTFWAEFTGTVKGINPQAYTVGEIWDVQPRWVGYHHFDGLMHYPLRTALIEFLNQKIHTREFGSKVDHLLNVYPSENLAGFLLLVGSHDTERIKTMFGGSVEKVKQAFLITMTFPGVPSIYYGDEVGMEGGKDPDCRRAFPWDENLWNRELHEWLRQLIEIRKNEESLRSGTFRIIQSGHPESVFAAVRATRNECILISINPVSITQDVAISLDDLGWETTSSVEKLIGDGEYRLEGLDLRLTIPAFRSVMFKVKGFKAQNE